MQASIIACDGPLEPPFGGPTTGPHVRRGILGENTDRLRDPQGPETNPNQFPWVAFLSFDGELLDPSRPAVLRLVEDHRTGSPFETLGRVVVTWFASDVRLLNNSDDQRIGLGDDLEEIGRFGEDALYSGIDLSAAVASFHGSGRGRFFHLRLHFEVCSDGDSSSDSTEFVIGPERVGRARIVQPGAPGAPAPEERRALVELFESTRGSEWTENQGWMGPAGSECSWFGIECEGGHVVGIDLPANGLEGTVPPSITELTQLQRLDLFGNRLSGTLEGWVTALTRLESLDLSFNRLTGGLGSGWDSMIYLTEIRLDGNELSGGASSFLSELARLRDVLGVSARDNRLTGAIAPGLGDLPRLYSLDLSGNRLTGSIPPNLTRLRYLQVLDLEGNLLTGELPERLGDMTSLSYLNASNNGLHGHIPKSVKDLRALRRLDLSGNQLDDLVPCELGGHERLTHIELHDNRLQGSIPPSLGKLPNLEVLTLARNDFGGQVPRSLLLLDQLETISLAHNGLGTNVRQDLRSFIAQREEGPSWLVTQSPAAPLGPNQTVRNWQNRTGISIFLVSLKSAWFGSPGSVTFRIRRVFACLPPESPLLAGLEPAASLLAREDLGDVALLARWGAPPTLDEYDYVSTPEGEFESIEIAGPRDGDLYLGVYSAQPNTETEIETIAPGMPEEAPPVPPGPYLETDELPGFRFKVQIDGSVPGVAEEGCIGETLCVSGALPGRSELFLRVIGPRPNGFLWTNLVRFTPAEIEVWAEQKSTGEVRYYRLGGLPRSSDLLTGRVDQEAFSPASGTQITWSETGRNDSFEPGPETLGAAVEFVPDEFPDYRFTVRILSNGEEIPARREARCLPETVCVSGALPGRSELFLRVIGPRPNNFFHVNLVRFTPSRVEVTVERLSTGEERSYVLDAIPRSSDALDGRLDRTAFGAGVS